MAFYISDKKDEALQNNQDTDTAKEQQSEYLTVTTKSKSTRNSTIVLAVLFIIGLISLFLGIKKTSCNNVSAAALDSQDLQLEMAIAKITGIKTTMTTQMDEIVKKFYEFSDVKQVKSDELEKNPFVRETSLGSNANLNQFDNIGSLEEQELRQAAKNMQLLSIMQSANSPDQTCCMIDDKILYKGESIKGFTISQINENSVKLKAGTLEVELKFSK